MTRQIGQYSAYTPIHTTTTAGTITDDDCGHSADMSAKSVDCVREGGEMSEIDSREKLEGLVRDMWREMITCRRA